MSMQKEMPEWLKKYYNILWAKYKKRAFGFKDVTKELVISRVMTVKVLWELEQRGFINKERSEIDYRARVYRLVSPEDISFVTGLYSLVEREKLEKRSVIEKLIFINDKLAYVITGSYAAYYYHHYIIPAKIFELKVETQDEGKWIAFLTDEKTRVSIGDIIETRKISNYVKLLHPTMPIALTKVKTEEGYYIEKPAFLLTELLGRQTQTSIIEVIAIVVQKKKELRWYGNEGIINLAKDFSFSRKLGYLLDAINFETRRPLIETEIIQEIEKDAVGKSGEIFPKDEIVMSRFHELRNKLVHKAFLTEEEIEELERIKEKFEGYESLNEKWGLLGILPREVVRKVLEDLGVRLEKY